MIAGILAASLPMVVIYTAISNGYGEQEGETAAVATLTATLLSFLTIAAVLALLL